MGNSFNHKYCYSHEDVIRKSKKKIYNKSDRKKRKNKLNLEIYTKFENDSFLNYDEEYDDFFDE